MLNFLPGPIKATFAFLLYVVNTLFWLCPIIVFSFLKALIPLPLWQKVFSYLLDQMASNWVAVNTLNQKLFSKTEFVVTGSENLTMQDWYLVLSNHQSWVDILVLQRLLHGKIPFLKFFLKKELIYVPFLGLAWWALDFPFMKRYSQSFLKKHPELKGKDIETTRKACEKFKHKPVSVMNFIEGTRYTPAKHSKQQSKFQHLLRPKAGGIAFVLEAMGQHLTKVVNVTIHYPEGIPSFLDFISGRVNKVVVAIDIIPIESSMIGDYFNDRQFKISFQQWVNQLWLEKDKTLTAMTEQHREKCSSQETISKENPVS
ncbi:acyltransferase [Thalassomonas actiniarum]|uniref:Acyltransferase n=1 Tax=Thalassomonas actiniarum TaxID=485447 RepID=A0AAE9YPQ1_9GAMM|nr:acyltransferase [Thalassomonas actiniarum]WDD98989.1 acyltransferase [Thalassomonas actiniarum]